jgi:hypothetical protein
LTEPTVEDGRTRTNIYRYKSVSYSYTTKRQIRTVQSGC